MRDFLASYSCALLTLDQCYDQLTVLYTLIKTFIEARYIEVPLNSSQVKSSQLCLGRVALSAIGWYQKGPCGLLRLHDKNSKITNYFKMKCKDFKK